MANGFEAKLAAAQATWSSIETDKDDVSADAADKLEQVTYELYTTELLAPNEAVSLIDHVLQTEDIEGWAVAVLASLRAGALEWDRKLATI